MSIKAARRLCQAFALLGSFALLGGCAEQQLAPIEQKSTNRTGATPAPKVPRPAKSDEQPATYRVVAGDTLYGIAWRFNLDARDIGRWNKLDDFNRIMAGQILKLRDPERTAPTAGLTARAVVGAVPAVTLAPPGALKPLPPPTGFKLPDTELPKAAGQLAVLPPTALAPTPLAPPAAASGTPPAAPVAASGTPPAAPVAAPPLAPLAPPATSSTDATAAARSAGGIAWRWPASGKRRSTVAATGAQGIDILGSRGQPVNAAADGQVVYSGNGLRGYGQLIIIKHSDVFLSAYAHNEKLLAGEGSKVKAGQQIALMGDSEADEVMLHFEIRKGGKAVEPMQFLPPR